MIGELSDAEIEGLLKSEIIAQLGCHADGRTYVVPITYAYDGEALIAHSAEGRKIWMMRANRHVCVEVDRLEGPSRWQSVVAWGTFEELAGADAERALETLRARFRSLATSASALPAGHYHGRDLARRKAVVFRIRLTEKSGRFERR
jgi:nitroimidazol reductase NimA-like FMN-containing flavoprotein (pyridoxamine 5'-phosphate oxidase superfamily)